MRRLSKEIGELLEGFFAPSNWTMMFHSLHHMADQIQQWGPVRDTWMFSFESMFGNLVRTIKTRSVPIPNIMHTWEVGRGVMLCKGLLGQAAERRRFGIALPRSAPLFPNKEVRLGETSKETRLTDAIKEELRQWLKSHEAYRKVRTLWENAKRNARRRRDRR